MAWSNRPMEYEDGLVLSRRSRAVEASSVKEFNLETSTRFGLPRMVSR